MHLRTASRPGWPIPALLLLLLTAALAVPPSAAAASSTERSPATGLAPAVATSNLVTNITLDLPSPNVLPLNEHVNLTFNYQTDEPGGVYIRVLPFSGALIPSYDASPSPLYPTGSGPGNAYFTITAGSVVVDQIHFQMWDASQSKLLLQVIVPVYYQFATSTEEVDDVKLSPMTPNVLADGQDVTVNFSYNTTQAGGVRIIAHPYTGGSSSVNSSIGAPPLYATGTGSGSSTFTITAGSVVVDHIRLEMWDAGQTILLSQSFIPVSYAFLPSATSVTGITGIALTPMNPNILDFGQDVNITFNYQTTGPGSVLIYVQPMTAGVPTPNSTASASPIYPAGSGTGSASFTVNGGLATVDSIRFQMWDAGHTTLLFAVVIPVHYRFGAVRQLYLPLLRN